MARVHHLGLDGHVVGQVEPGEQRFERRAVEPSHQLVTQRQVEPRLAGVTLATGAAAQLVVDARATRAVRCRARRGPPASTTFSASSLGLRLDGGERIVPGGLVILGRLHRIEALSPQPLVGQEVGVAAERDVGTAACHVGGDGDRAEAAGLGALP